MTPSHSDDAEKQEVDVVVVAVPKVDVAVIGEVVADDESAHNLCLAVEGTESVTPGFTACTCERLSFAFLCCVQIIYIFVV